MKGKNPFLVIICILIVVISGCIFMFQKMTIFEMDEETKNDDSNEEEMTVSDMEWASAAEVTEATISEKNKILFFISDDIAKNNLFNSFIKGQVGVYDSANEKNVYITEYYEKYSEYSINAVSFIAEDVNRDGENELLLHLRWHADEGIILVFHAQEGQLYQWQSLQYGMHSPQIMLYDNGVIEITGTAWSRSFFSYSSEGNLERVFDCYSTTEDLENGDSSRQYIISEYRNGIKINECSITEVKYSTEADDWELLESQDAVEEFDKILNGFLNSLGEGKQINTIQNEENTEVITLEELMDNNYE